MPFSLWLFPPFFLRSGGNCSKETRINEAIVQRLFGWHVSLSLAVFPEGSSLLFEPYSIGDDPEQGSGIEQIGLSDDDASQSNASTIRPPLYYNLMGQPVRQLRRGEHGFLIPFHRR